MTICSFWQQGRCNKGSQCKFEHPGHRTLFDGGSGNRFAPLSGQQPRSGFGNRDYLYHLSKDVITVDLKGERPIWPLSAYGPGKDAPRQLIDGDMSPEELRSQFYKARASGNEAAGRQQEAQLGEQMSNQIASILKDLDGACRYVEDGTKERGNRIELAAQFKGNGQFAIGRSNLNAPTGPSATRASPFGGAPSGFGAATQTPAFGKPSAPAFGQPGLSAFGQTSAPAASSPFGQPAPASAFGQTSSLGQGSAFGKPSIPGQTSAFGQQSALGHGSAFGQPSQPGAASAFGKPSFPGATSAFGQPSQPGAASAFGQPSQPGAASAFGQPSQPGAASAFGKPSQPGATTGFGQPSQLGAKPAFGQTSQPATASAFGQTSQPGTASAFGQPSQPGATSAFGKPSQPGTAFGQSSVPGQTSGFGQSSTVGQPSAFGKPAFGQSAFGQPSQPGAPSAFGQPSQPGAFGKPAAPAFGQPAAPGFGAGSAPAQSAFGQQAQTTSPSPFGQPAAPPSAVSSVPQPAAAKYGPNGRLMTWKGLKVHYFQNGHPYYPLTPQANPNMKTAKDWQRVWFPNGPPPNDHGKDEFKEGKPEEYQGDAGKKLEEIFTRLKLNGMFVSGEKVPEVPPKMVWVNWEV